MPFSPTVNIKGGGFMKIIAKGTRGAEFFYNPHSAHKVSRKSADTILSALNASNYDLKDSEVWHIYNVDSYDNAYYIAESQAFTIRKGKIYEKRC